MFLRALRGLDPSTGDFNDTRIAMGIPTKSRDMPGVFEATQELLERARHCVQQLDSIVTATSLQGAMALRTFYATHNGL